MADPANPLVSIGIPTYNRANSYLNHALRSAVNQTYTNIEIIVSDNCSADDTETVVKEFNDPRIRFYRQQENIGALRNCNFCLEQSRGKYFLLLLDDDLVDDDFVSTCVAAIKGHAEPGIVLTGAREIDAQGNILSVAHNRVSGCSTGEFILGWFDRKVPLYLCSTLFNTERLKQLGGFHSKTNMYEDVVAYVQLAAKFGRVDVFDIKASFRRHGSNLGSAARYYDWSEDALYLLDIMCEAAPDQAAVIRQKGLVYFCSRVYSHVARIKSPLKRFSAYLTVYKAFDYRCSPIRFLYVTNARRIMNFVKRQIASL